MKILLILCLLFYSTEAFAAFNINIIGGSGGNFVINGGGGTNVFTINSGGGSTPVVGHLTFNTSVLTFNSSKLQFLGD